MRMVVGLGNPGREYEATRHNAGFWWVENLADAQRVSLRAESRYHGRVGKLAAGDHDCFLLLPQTYMNDSGRAVQAAMQFYKAEPNDLTVLYDEIDLEFGKVRVKKGGGAAGHNGIRSIDAHIGPDFWRVRIGVGHPGVKALVKHYVLHDFDAEEKPEVETMVGAIADNFALLYERGHEHFMTKVALAINPPPPKPPRQDKAPED